VQEEQHDGTGIVRSGFACQPVGGQDGAELDVTLHDIAHGPDGLDRLLPVQGGVMSSSGLTGRGNDSWVPDLQAAP
jgi:hypothetical protein